MTDNVFIDTAISDPTPSEPVAQDFDANAALLVGAVLEAHALADNEFSRGYAMGLSVAAGIMGLPKEFWASPERDEAVAKWKIDNA